MEQLPNIIKDLAYILIVAGAVTIVFKRLHQPLVLGYIVAGFLAGPHMSYMPSVNDVSSISEWSQIGVIFLMFTLGLEFSFKRIVVMGIRPIVSAVMVMLCMIGIGGGVGALFGWSYMDRLFLGGMLAMSSTTIIYKAFDDLGIRHRKFSSLVLSVLILEDILGILLMVILSALAVSREFEGMALMGNLMELGFFLILWFLVGIYMVPNILRRYRRYINSETLLVVSVGLCFLLVVIAGEVGYSPAFGAFMMGSILAETVEAERIEQTVGSLKDLFGAIFFVSVGMLVDPSILLQYWLPIVVITLAVIVGQMLLGSLSFFVAGHSLQDSMQCGFSLVQIGEFAFIIAALGQSLGVTSSFLYPVVVAVSIVTTFFTPYSIRMAPAAYKRVMSVLPSMAGNILVHQQEKRGTMAFVQHPTDTILTVWKRFLQVVVSQTIAYLTLSIAVILFSLASLLPLMRQLFGQQTGGIVCAIITLIIISPCIRPIAVRKNHSQEAKFIRSYSKFHNALYWCVVACKMGISLAVVFRIVSYILPIWWVWQMLLSIGIMALIVVSRVVKFVSIHIERTYRQNLISRELNSESPSYGKRLKGSDLQIASFSIPHHTRWGGHTLSQLNFGRTEHINIVAIVRGKQRINIPGGNNRIYPGDTIEIVADEAGIAAFKNKMEQSVDNTSQSQLRNKLHLISVTISATSPMCGKTLMDLNLRSQYHCMVVGIEDADGNLHLAQAQRPLRSGDIVWLVGEEADLCMLKMGI